MKAYFLKLYEYNQWANRHFATVLSQNNFQNSKILTLFAHIHNAQMIWLNRIQGDQEKSPGVWEEPALSESTELLSSSSRAWLEYINGGPDFDEIIIYTDSKGEKHETKLGDIVAHVANHGTHHRGQIATLLRQENIAPPASDYIFFVRDKERSS